MIDGLLDDPDIPDDALDQIEYLYRAITSRGLARRIFFSLPRGRLTIDGTSSNARVQQVIEYYSNERKDLLKTFLTAFVSAIYAISYQNQVFGFLFRRLAFFDLDRHRRRGVDIVASLRAGGAREGAAAT